MKAIRSSLLIGVIGSLLCAGIARPASAATSEVGAATFTSQNLGGGEWQYDMTLTNESKANNANTTIGTFWFAWAPGQEYMEAAPTDIQAPANWTFNITGNEHAGDGYGIQYVAMSGDLLTAGNSLDGFIFDSAEDPAQLTGPSTFFQNQIENTSAAYTQGPFTDTTNSGDVFVVTDAGMTSGRGGGGGGTGVSAVPLPAAAWQTLAGLVGLGLLAAGKRVMHNGAQTNF